MYSSFDVMSAIFPIFFILVAVLVVFTIIRGLAEWNKNNQSPRLTVDAKVVSKRENTRGCKKTPLTEKSPRP